jgi:hypothetical protein
LIIGGQRRNGTKTNSVEVYNWQTSSTCFSEYLPYNISGMVGTLMNGIQIFCGGEATIVLTKCYKLLEDLSWKEVS